MTNENLSSDTSKNMPQTTCAMALFALMSGASALELTPTISRRSLVTGCAGLAPFALARGRATAADQVCFGKCPEDPAKAAERRAIQNGSSNKPPPTFAQLVEASITQRENTLGMSLSDEEKAQIEAKVRAAYPGTK